MEMSSESAENVDESIDNLKNDERDKPIIKKEENTITTESKIGEQVENLTSDIMIKTKTESFVIPKERTTGPNSSTKMKRSPSLESQSSLTSFASSLVSDSADEVLSDTS